MSSMMNTNRNDDENSNVSNDLTNDLAVAFEESFVALDQELKQLDFLESNTTANSATRAAFPTVYGENDLDDDDDDDDDYDYDDSDHVDNLRKELTDIKSSHMMMMGYATSSSISISRTQTSHMEPATPTSAAVGDVGIMDTESDDNSSFSSSQDEFFDESAHNDSVVIGESNQRMEQQLDENDNSENIDPIEVLEDGTMMLPRDVKKLQSTNHHPFPPSPVQEIIGQYHTPPPMATTPNTNPLGSNNENFLIGRPTVTTNNFSPMAYNNNNNVIPADAVGETLLIGGGSSGGDSSFSSREEFENEDDSPWKANRMSPWRISPFQVKTQYTQRPDPPPSSSSWGDNLTRIIMKSPPATKTRRFAIDADADGYSSQLPTPEEYRASPAAAAVKRPLQASYDNSYETDDYEFAATKGRRKWSKKCIMLVCLLVLLPPAILVPLVILQSRVAHLEQVILFLVQNNISTEANLRLLHSPQNKAAKWIANMDDYSPRSIEPSMHNEFLDRYVLAVLYFALGGDTSWAHSLNFLESEHVCNWRKTFHDLEGNKLVYGVTECHEIGNKQVPVGLSMAFQSLRGRLPDELQFLTGLETLILQYNSRLEGEFPSSIRFLRNLRRLSLEHCSLAGTLPEWLEELTELTSLGLGDNVFSGAIPQAITAMTNLKFLGLDDNEFVADLTLFGSLTNLEYLYLDSNEIGGKLTPNLLKEWKNLKELDLSRNQLSSTIPETLFSHKQLRVVDLHGNRLEGPIPELEVEANGSLQYLALHDNFLTNHIPTSIGFLVALKHLDLSGNNLEGTLPNTLENIFNLEYLFAGDNSFYPQDFPGFLLEMEMLKELSLKAINMTGSIPLEIDSLSSLRYLDLSQNQMKGTIPPAVGSLTDLEYLLLQDNGFSGNLPSTLSRLGKLQTVLLEQNKLEGDTDMLCENSSTKSIATLVSDCEEPTMTCSCCTFCCLSSDANCNSINYGSNLDPKKEYGYRRAGEKGFIGATP